MVNKVWDGATSVETKVTVNRSLMGGWILTVNALLISHLSIVRNRYACVGFFLFYFTFYLESVPEGVQVVSLYMPHTWLQILNNIYYLS